MTILQIPDIAKYGGFMAANHPALYGPGSIVQAFARPDGACEVHWPESAGPAPTVEAIMAWQPNPVAQLPALDAARQAKWLAAREASADALLAEGWTLEQTMAAGAEFVNAYAALSFGYWYGGAAGSTPQTNLLLAIQADTEREWLDLGSPTVREQMLAILQ